MTTYLFILVSALILATGVTPLVRRERIATASWTNQARVSNTSSRRP